MSKRIGLKLLRVERDLKQDDVAKMCGTTKPNYCLIENGKRKGSIEFWNGIQKAYCLTGDQIWNLQNGKKADGGAQ